MDPRELVPLEGGLPQPYQLRRASRPARPYHLKSCFAAPLRLCRLLAFMFLVPSLFIFIPLYLRYRVYSGQMYPMSMTDMRLIDSKISTTWCQRQVVRSNATFNAYVVPGQPQLAEDLIPVSMTRELELDDDMKEYWGFYLLKGSTVTVSACVSFPGASLIMIKGYKHLQECAYIGDDSSEELDELLQANRQGLLSDSKLFEKLMQLRREYGKEDDPEELETLVKAHEQGQLTDANLIKKIFLKEDGKANNPDTMKRHKAGVSFHDPSHSENVTSSDAIPNADVTDQDPKELREILERLHAIRQAAKTESLKHYQPPAHLMDVPELHRHRNTNVDKDERKWLTFKDIDGNNKNQETVDSNLLDESRLPEEVPASFLEITPKRDDIKEKYVKNNKINNNDKILQLKEEKENNRSDIENSGNRIEINKIDTSYTEDRPIAVTETKQMTTEFPYSKEELNSKEVFEDVLKKLQALGDKGKRVLVKLQKTMGVKYEEPSLNQNIMAAVKGNDEDLDRLRKVLVEAIDEEKTRGERQKKRMKSMQEARAKRELMLEKDLNEDDEARNNAAEEGLTSDFYADDHKRLNESTPFDMSKSEFWSSFSSSEEALLECSGLILNLPLSAHKKCRRGLKDAGEASRANALTYRVPVNGYYFFIFNSENEVQTNFIRARFDLQKTRYDAARALRECMNTTERCDLKLDMFSEQKVVLEVPLRDNDSLWNEQFVIISECEPRTSIYLFCVIIVPVLILVFAFQ